MTDAKTFDLAAALAGRTYPQEKVVVFLDEALMYAYSKAREESNQDPANVEKLEALDTLEAAFKDAAMTVTLRGVAPHMIKQMSLEIEEKFPLQQDSFGRLKPNADRGEEFSRRMWALYVIRIETADGSALLPTSEDLDMFRQQAPEACISAIDEGITRLRNGAEAGYNKVVQEPDFLSMR